MDPRLLLLFSTVIILVSVPLAVGETPPAAPPQTAPSEDTQCGTYKETKIVKTDGTDGEKLSAALTAGKEEYTTPTLCGHEELTKFTACKKDEATKKCEERCKKKPCESLTPPEKKTACEKKCADSCNVKGDKEYEIKYTPSGGSETTEKINLPGFGRDCATLCKDEIEKKANGGQWPLVKAVRDNHFDSRECNDCITKATRTAGFTEDDCRKLAAPDKCKTQLAEFSGNVKQCGPVTAAILAEKQKAEAIMKGTPTDTEGGAAKQLSAEEKRIADLNAHKLNAEIANLETQTGMAREQFEFQKENARAQLALQEKQISSGLLGQIISPTISGLFGLAQAAMQKQDSPESGSPGSGGTGQTYTPPPSKLCRTSTGATFTTTGECPVISESYVAGQSDTSPIRSPLYAEAAAEQGRKEAIATAEQSTPTTAAVFDGFAAITGAQSAESAYSPTPADPALDFHNREKIVAQQFRQQAATLTLQKTQSATPRADIEFLSQSLLREFTTGASQDLANLYKGVDEVTITNNIHVIHGYGTGKPNVYTLDGSENNGVEDQEGIIRLSPGGVTRIAVANPDGAIIKDPDGNKVILKPGLASYVGTGGPQSGWDTGASIIHGDSGAMILPTDNAIFVTFKRGYAPLAPNAVDITPMAQDQYAIQTRGTEDLLLVGLNNIIPLASRGALKGSSHIIYYKDALPANAYVLGDSSGYQYTFQGEDLNGRVRGPDGKLIFSTSNPPLILSSLETALLYDRVGRQLAYVDV